MIDDTNDAWMKPGPPDLWRVLGRRLFGCLLLLALLLLLTRLFLARLLGITLGMGVLSLPFVLWLLSLLLFARARFWHDPQPLWGYLTLTGGGWGRWALRLLATLLTVVLGLKAFLLIVAFLAIPFAGGHWF